MKKIISLVLVLALSLLISVPAFASEIESVDNGVVLYNIKYVDNFNDITQPVEVLGKSAVQYADGSIFEVVYTGTKPEKANAYDLLPYSVARATSYVNVTATGTISVRTRAVSATITLHTNFWFNSDNNTTGKAYSNIGVTGSGITYPPTVVTSGNDWADNKHWTRETLNFKFTSGFGVVSNYSIWTQVYSNGENYHHDEPLHFE